MGERITTWGQLAAWFGVDMEELTGDSTVELNGEPINDCPLLNELLSDNPELLELVPKNLAQEQRYLQVHNY